MKAGGPESPRCRLLPNVLQLLVSTKREVAVVDVGKLVVREVLVDAVVTIVGRGDIVELVTLVFIGDVIADVEVCDTVEDVPGG